MPARTARRTRSGDAAAILPALACLAALLATLLAAGSCSSTPRRPDTVVVTRNRAAEATASGNSYFRQGRYDLALRFFTQALELNTSVDNLEGIVQSANSIGKVSMALGDLDGAEQLFTRAREQAGSSRELAALCEGNLGELAMRRGDYDKALAIFDGILAGAAGKTGGLPDELYALILHNRGTAHKNLGDGARAREDLSRSLALNLAAKRVEEAAADYYALASLDTREGLFESAKQNALQALNLDKQVENSLGIAKDLYALGVVSSRLGDTASAYDYFRRSYQVSTTLSLRADMQRALGELAASAEALGRAEEAAQYRKTLAELGAAQ
jgi:tetratricopeptide (TPR) repeat protein